MVRVRIPASKVRYFRENLGAPFIIGFMILLMIAATCLCFRLEGLANDVAVYAYYLLVAGVVLQLASYLKCERNKGKDASETA